jgi:hypothetical protein
MLKELDLVYRTMFAELGQRCLDAEFDRDFSETGRFRKVAVKGRDYWYFEDRQGAEGKLVRRYVGPDADPEIAKRVAAFQTLKDNYRARRKLVSTLTREAGLPSPDRLTGDLVEAFWKHGLFRLRVVLVGTAAFQCYSGLLGVKLPSAPMQTGDVDFAQFHSVSVSIEDTLPPVVEILRQVDPSFREVPHISDGRQATQFINDQHYKVEFLTPNRGSAEHDGQPTKMPALGGAAATPLRFLDFLITEPARSVMLHKGGISVLVPTPERFAVHKMIVAMRRRQDTDGALKQEKDLRQAGLLAAALEVTRRAADFAEAFKEAWDRGPAWRQDLTRARSMLPTDLRGAFDRVLSAGREEVGRETFFSANPAPAPPR